LPLSLPFWGAAAIAQRFVEPEVYETTASESKDGEK
jgi:hypothetical protein